LNTRLAKALAIVALILFLISGVDVATNTAGGGDLLPLSSMVRGMVFGFGAAALATAAFLRFSEESINFGIDLVNYYWHSCGDSRRGVY
jgi:hypothetical protein